MRCPKCEETHLESKTVHKVEIDECESCRGIWFEQNELRMVKDRTDDDLNWLDFDLWKHEDRFHAVDRPYPCPRCDEQMMGMLYGDTRVEVVCCTSCKGVWLDGGQLERIIEALEKELLTMSVSDYAAASLREARDIFAGEEGLASDWRDFTNVLRMLEYRLFSGSKLMQLLMDLGHSNPVR